MPHPRRAASYPPEFMRLLHHVASTGQPLFIDNLANERRSYVTLRARLSAFRKAYHDEAVASGDPHRIATADLLYTIIFRNPEQRNGKWGLLLDVRESEFAEKLGELLPDAAAPAPSPEESPKAESAGLAAIKDIFGPKEGEGDDE